MYSLMYSVISKGIWYSKTINIALAYLDMYSVWQLFHTSTHFTLHATYIHKIMCRPAVFSFVVLCNQPYTSGDSKEMKEMLSGKTPTPTVHADLFTTLAWRSRFSGLKWFPAPRIPGIVRGKLQCDAADPLLPRRGILTYSAGRWLACLIWEYPTCLTRSSRVILQRCCWGGRLRRKAESATDPPLHQAAVARSSPLLNARLSSRTLLLFWLMAAS